jgi:endonuclease/exonuclease/phosphatase family metal-dependent hydrolase
VGFSLNVLTINTHKGFTAFNRRFILPELRDAVRSVSADIVCLQEVMGRTSSSAAYRKLAGYHPL